MSAALAAAVEESLEESRQETCRWLVGRSPRHSFNDQVLAAMLASNSVGLGSMPPLLGLEPELFGRMLRFTFPGVNWPVAPAADAAAGCRGDVAAQMPEYEELKSLFTEFAAPQLKEEPWWIELMIVGCSGREHLWRDMGLFERRDLTRLIRNCFPELGRRNTRDMKWKKFIYKQLCEREGIIACPAPTCEQCASFSECFAPED